MCKTYNFHLKIEKESINYVIVYIKLLFLFFLFTYILLV